MAIEKEALKKEVSGDIKNAILYVLSDLGAIASRKKQIIKTHNEESLRHFLALPEAQCLEIISKFNEYKKVFTIIADATEKDLTIEDEIACLEAVFSANNLEYREADYGPIEMGDIIEVYNREGRQLYGNFELMKICPYDLLTVASYPWHELYDRPEAVNRMIFQKYADLLASPHKTWELFDVPRHLLKLKRIPQNNDTYFVNFKKAVPLFAAGTDDKVGAILTSSGALALESSEGKKVTNLRKAEMHG